MKSIILQSSKKRTSIRLFMPLIVREIGVVFVMLASAIRPHLLGQMAVSDMVVREITDSWHLHTYVSWPSKVFLKRMESDCTIAKVLLYEIDSPPNTFYTLF